MRGARNFQESGSVGGAILRWQISRSRCAGANRLPATPWAAWQRALGRSQGRGVKGSKNRRGRRERKEEESQREWGQRDKKRGEPTCEGNREFLFILPAVILQGGFELLPNMTVNYFNLYFSPQSP